MKEPKEIGQKTLVVDIDDHLILYDDNGPGCIEKYKNGKPNEKEIKLLNQFYKNGSRVILWTGRGWDKYEFTKKQLAGFGIKHHELVMGKPQGIYVDIDSIKSLGEL